MDKSVSSTSYRALLSLLRETRKASKLTQEELAARLGETQSFISKCERGERRLDVLELRAWCLALGMGLPAFVALLEERIPTGRKARKP